MRSGIWWLGTVVETCLVSLVLGPWLEGRERVSKMGQERRKEKRSKVQGNGTGKRREGVKEGRSEGGREWRRERVKEGESEGKEWRREGEKRRKGREGKNLKGKRNFEEGEREDVEGIKRDIWNPSLPPYLCIVEVFLHLGKELPRPPALQQSIEWLQSIPS